MARKFRQCEAGRLFKSNKIKGRLIRFDSLMGDIYRPEKPAMIPQWLPPVEQGLLKVMRVVRLGFAGNSTGTGNLWNHPIYTNGEERPIVNNQAWDVAFNIIIDHFRKTKGLFFTGISSAVLDAEDPVNGPVVSTPSRFFRGLIPPEYFDVYDATDSIYIEELTIIIVSPDTPRYFNASNIGYLNDASIPIFHPFTLELVRQSYIFMDEFVRDEDMGDICAQFSAAASQNHTDDIAIPNIIMPRYKKQKTLVYADVGSEGYFGEDPFSGDGSHWRTEEFRDSDDSVVTYAYYTKQAVFSGAAYIYTKDDMDNQDSQEYIPYSGGNFGFIFGNNTEPPLYGPDPIERSDNEYGFELDGQTYAVFENLAAPVICTPGTLWIPAEHSSGADPDEGGDEGDDPPLGSAMFGDRGPVPEIPDDAVNGDTGGHQEVMIGFGGVPFGADADERAYTGQIIELISGYPILVEQLVSQLPALCASVHNTFYMGTVNWHHINTQPFIDAIKEFFEIE